MDFLNSHKSCLALTEVGFGVRLTFSAWGPGGPGAPALPGNPGGPCVNKEVGRDGSGLLPPSFWVGAIYLPDPPWLPMRPCSPGLGPEIYHGHVDCFSHPLPPRPSSIFIRQALLLPVGPPFRGLLCLYSPVDLGSLAGLEIPRGRSGEVSSPA